VNNNVLSIIIPKREVKMSANKYQKEQEGRHGLRAHILKR
jgi:hypothetical protein